MSSRMRKTSSKTKQRRSHHKVSSPRLSECNNCGKMHRRHHVCDNCGHYRENEVVDKEAELEKKLTRMKQKAKERGEDPSEVELS